MTRIAREGRKVAGPAWLRVMLLVALLSLLAARTPTPWGHLWIMVPASVALSLLCTWRFGRWGVAVPTVLFLSAMAIEGAASIWVWWIPVAALTGVWMGLREETGAPAAGQRAWMLLPLLLLAAALPWMLRYPELIADFGRAWREGDDRFVALMREFGVSGARMVELERVVSEQARLRDQVLPNVLPTLLFVWAVALVALGRALSSRLAGAFKWPALSRPPLISWRLPDGALWLLLGSLGLLLTQWRDWIPTAWTLLINTALGYSVQGIAVVESVLLARGVPLSVIVLTMLFMFTLAAPVFVLTTAALGLSDVWLDYRHLETQPEHEKP